MIQAVRRSLPATPPWFSRRFPVSIPKAQFSWVSFLKALISPTLSVGDLHSLHRVTDASGGRPHTDTITPSPFLQLTHSSKNSPHQALHTFWVLDPLQLFQETYVAFSFLSITDAFFLTGPYQHAAMPGQGSTNPRSRARLGPLTALVNKVLLAQPDLSVQVHQWPLLHWGS